MNHHLNLFRFYNESQEKEFIENNLSRAFTLCLSNNGFFLSEYLKAILSLEDYEYLFSSLSADIQCLIDIQIDTALIEREEYNKVYAVAMTADKSLSMDDFFSQPHFGERKNTTDIFISIKDIAIIIEVKRTGEDCKAQLYNQLLPFIQEKYNVIPVKFSWQETIKMLEKVKHVQQIISQDSIFIKDFVELSEVRYPMWFEPKPFYVIPFKASGNKINSNQLVKRMRQAIAGISSILGEKYQLLPYNDRLGITVPFGWANELNIGFKTTELKSDEYIEFLIYPGNTKQQGYQVFNKALDWQNNKILKIKGTEYDISIEYHIKLCHFNKYVSGIWLDREKEMRYPLYTKSNFYDYSGKWERKDWGEFEEFMDKHFMPDYNWREELSWSNKFTDTDRNYFTLSLGYEVSLKIPYSQFKTIDKSEDDVVFVTEFLNNIINAFNELI